MAGMTSNAARVVLGVRGMTRDAGTSVAAALSALPGVTRATPDEGRIEGHYDPSQLPVMDLVRSVRSQGFLAGML
ncbi:heavy-metal-associated domain-containing protein [Deinococcus sp.]|uniref:heavy-metal-associated domain-containing protein n=1 Tax=Deinococcus sp. TaxID=47478 RepID=UPI0025B8CC85|nr:heavy-metal-associated domain-containing protein [Deinococcus sp.]